MYMFPRSSWLSKSEVEETPHAAIERNVAMWTADVLSFFGLQRLETDFGLRHPAPTPKGVLFNQPALGVIQFERCALELIVQEVKHSTP